MEDSAGAGHAHSAPRLGASYLYLDTVFLFAVACLLSVLVCPSISLHSGRGLLPVHVTTPLAHGALAHGALAHRSPLFQRDDPVDHSAVYGDFVAGSDHVPDVLGHGAQKPMDAFMQQRGEALYKSVKREPLGKSFSRGHVLPDRVGSPCTRGATAGLTVAPTAEAPRLRVWCQQRHVGGCKEPVVPSRRGGA